MSVHDTWRYTRPLWSDVYTYRMDLLALSDLHGMLCAYESIEAFTRADVEVAESATYVILQIRGVTAKYRQKTIKNPDCVFVNLDLCVLDVCRIRKALGWFMRDRENPDFAVWRASGIRKDLIPRNDYHAWDVRYTESA